MGRFSPEGLGIVRHARGAEVPVRVECGGQAAWRSMREVTPDNIRACFAGIVPEVCLVELSQRARQGLPGGDGVIIQGGAKIGTVHIAVRDERFTKED